MTSDELERAIDFLLKSGARCDVRLAQLSEEVTRVSGVVDRLSEKVDRLSEKVDRQSDDFAQLSARLDSFADTQANIMRVMMQTFEKQADINESLRKSIDSMRESEREEHNALREEMRELGAATDRRLNALIEAMDRGRDAGR